MEKVAVTLERIILLQTGPKILRDRCCHIRVNVSRYPVVTETLNRKDGLAINSYLFNGIDFYLEIPHATLDRDHPL
jgi:hypothetical protein